MKLGNSNSLAKVSQSVVCITTVASVFLSEATDMTFSSTSVDRVPFISNSNSTSAADQRGLVLSGAPR